MNHMNATTSQIVKKVNFHWFHLLRPDPFIFPPLSCSRTHTPSGMHTYTLRHTPTTLYVSGRQRGEANKRARDFVGRAEETFVVSRSDKQLPPPALHFLHHSPLDLWLDWAPQTLTHIYFCSSGTALLSQHAASGGVSSSHGGSVQR